MLNQDGSLLPSCLQWHPTTAHDLFVEVGRQDRTIRIGAQTPAAQNASIRRSVGIRFQIRTRLSNSSASNVAASTASSAAPTSISDRDCLSSDMLTCTLACPTIKWRWRTRQLTAVLSAFTGAA